MLAGKVSISRVTAKTVLHLSPECWATIYKVAVAMGIEKQPGFKSLAVDAVLRDPKRGVALLQRAQFVKSEPSGGNLPHGNRNRKGLRPGKKT